MNIYKCIAPISALCSCIIGIIVIPYWVGSLVNYMTNICEHPFVANVMLNTWLFGVWVSLMTIFGITAVYISFKVATGRGL